MDDAFDRFTAEIGTALIEQGRLPTDQVELLTPKPGIAGDLAFPTSRLAHERGAPAPHVAQRLADTLRFAA